MCLQLARRCRATEGFGLFGDEASHGYVRVMQGEQAGFHDSCVVELEQACFQVRVVLGPKAVGKGRPFGGWWVCPSERQTMWAKVESRCLQALLIHLKMMMMKVWRASWIL